MLRACAKGDIIVPLMTCNLEKSEDAIQALTCSDKSKKLIVPAEGEGGSYQQRAAVWVL